MREKISADDLTLNETVVKVNRVAKVVKGGRRFSFSALVVVGDKQGHIGFGLGKANEVPDAIRKATDQAKKAILLIPLRDGTIAHRVNASYGASTVMLRPASAGTGIIAGGAVRAVVEAAGVHNILTKTIGNSNPHNVIKATMKALEALEDPERVLQIRREGTMETAA